MSKSADEVLCHLCETLISRKNWSTIEGHRGKCATDHMNILITFEHHPDHCCPYCDGPLLQWPKRGELVFVCDESLQE